MEKIPYTVSRVVLKNRVVSGLSDVILRCSPVKWSELCGGIIVCCDLIISDNIHMFGPR